jgi:hypothetical protein
MRNVITLICAAFLFAGTGFAAQGQAKGELQVTAVVRSSATWVEGADGAWNFVLANAPGSQNTLSALHQYKAANSSVDGNARKNISTSTPCRTHTVHGGANIGRCSQ